MRRRLGNEALEKIAEPMMAGILRRRRRSPEPQLHLPALCGDGAEARQPAESHAGSTAQSAAGLSPHTPFVSFHNGLQEMVERLVQRLTENRVTLRHGVAVEAWEPGRLRLKGGETVNADTVILAVPAYAAAELLAPAHARLAERLREIPYEASATILVGWPKSALQRIPRGFGFVVPRRERQSLLACTWTSSKWAGRAPESHVLLRGYLAGPSVAAMSADTIAKAAVHELAVTMGAQGEPDLVHVRHLPRGTPHYLVGHLQWVEQVETLAWNCPVSS